LVGKQILKKMDLKVKILMVSMCQNQKVARKILVKKILSYH
jgi:hypothetical protein